MKRKILSLLSLVNFLAVIGGTLAFADDYCFQEAGYMYGVAPEVLWVIAKGESNFNPQIVHWNSNGSYDYGTMQINSCWYITLGKDRWNHLADPCYNIKVGAWILAQCIQRYGYTWEAVGCYNTGPNSTNITAQVKYVKRMRRILERMSNINKDSLAGGRSDALGYFGGNNIPSTAWNVSEH
ncbi:MAG: lytic transglycosylase domain-containing protein [Dissulfurispiraceae bacterium]